MKERMIVSLIFLLAGLEATFALDPVSYLSRYGYYSDARAVSATPEEKEVLFENSIKFFQERTRLNVTGQLDDATKALMARPRCGMRDIYHDEARNPWSEWDPKIKQQEEGPRRRRQKRYALRGSKWNKKVISYKLLNYPTDPTLSKPQVNFIIKKAFSEWSNYTKDLKFQHAAQDDKEDITMLWTTRDHNDPYNFDGPGVTEENHLAHGFYPDAVEPLRGDVHYDDDDKWKFEDPGRKDAYDLHWVTLHELGHSLGLKHSENPDAVMYAYYRDSDVRLTGDDIAAIQYLYGRPTFPPTSTTTSISTTLKPSTPTNGFSTPSSPITQSPPRRTPPPDMPDLCADPKIDAMTQLSEGSSFARRVVSIYVFKGEWMWKLHPSRGIDWRFSKPTKIRERFPDVPTPIDGAVYHGWHDRHSMVTFLFKGAMAYEVVNGRRTTKPPRKITDIFDIKFRKVRDINAAVKWSRNNDVYFFKGSKYYRENKFLFYPRKISKSWKGVPNDLDAAMQISGPRRTATYFIKGDEYYRYDDMSDKVEPNFPKSMRKYFFMCPGMKAAASEVRMLDQEGFDYIPKRKDGDDSVIDYRPLTRNIEDGGGAGRGCKRGKLSGDSCVNGSADSISRAAPILLFAIISFTHILKH